MSVHIVDSGADIVLSMWPYLILAIVAVWIAGGLLYVWLAGPRISLNNERGRAGARDTRHDTPVSRFS